MPPQKQKKLPAPCFGQVKDYKDQLWNVGEERPTEHGWSLLLGWPALDTYGHGQRGGGRRIIVTKELVAYLDKMRMTPGKAKLPICADAVSTLRQRLGMSWRKERKEWWKQVECELCSPAPQFAAAHNVSATTATKHRRKHGISSANKRWTDKENALLHQLLQEKLPIATIAQKLDRTESAVKSQRRIVSGKTVQPYTEPRLRWTQEEKDKLTAMVQAGHSHKEIAIALGRSTKAVINMCSNLFSS